MEGLRCTPTLGKTIFVAFRRGATLASAGLIKPDALGRALVVVAKVAHAVEAKRRRIGTAHRDGRQSQALP